MVLLRPAALLSQAYLWFQEVPWFQGDLFSQEVQQCQLGQLFLGCPLCLGALQTLEDQLFLQHPSFQLDQMYLSTQYKATI